MKPAIFLDRDGVLIEDVDLLTKPEQIRILPHVPRALKALKKAGFALVVVSNQTVVARGLASEADVRAINHRLQELLVREDAPNLDGWYFCPHHPNAVLPAYRAVCECRKPGSGMLLQAAREHDLNLPASFTVGDRITDIVAGAKAGTRTILVQTGKHADPPIETAEPMDTSIKPDYICPDLLAAAEWILGRHRE